MFLHFKGFFLLTQITFNNWSLNLTQCHAEAQVQTKYPSLYLQLSAPFLKSLTSLLYSNLPL